jgi:glycosyltransferase involved in cell wall biosynthesis
MAGKVMAVVVPCFNEEAVLPETHSRLMALLDEMIAERII